MFSWIYNHFETKISGRLGARVGVVYVLQLSLSDQRQPFCGSPVLREHLVRILLPLTYVPNVRCPHYVKLQRQGRRREVSNVPEIICIAKTKSISLLRGIVWSEYILIHSYNVKRYSIC